MSERNEYSPTLNYVPNIIRSEDFKFPTDPQLMKEVETLLTPQNILQTVEFMLPKVISPEKYPIFELLVRERNRIQRLELLPVKTEAEYIRYHKQPKDQLLSKIYEYLGDSPMALAPNLFGYFLPEDLAQYIVWIRNKETENKQIVEFITRCMQLHRLSSDEIILFERPIGIDSKLVRGTFAGIRHIHFWEKIK